MRTISVFGSKRIPPRNFIAFIQYTVFVGGITEVEESF